jgi:hypothetical protein
MKIRHEHSGRFNFAMAKVVIMKRIWNKAITNSETLEWFSKVWHIVRLKVSL